MSTLNVSNISDGTTSVGTNYVVNGSAKAWINFNGTGTVAIYESLNFSSLTDASTGQYITSYTSGMANANYTHFGHSNSYNQQNNFAGAGRWVLGVQYGSATEASTSSTSLISWNSGYIDGWHCELGVQGDLA